MNDFLIDFRLAVYTAVAYCPLPMPRGETRYTVTGRLLGITSDEVEQLCREVKNGGRVLDKAAVRCGYHLTRYGILKRGHLRSMPPYADLLRTFEVEEWIEWLAANDKYHVLWDMWYAFGHKNPPGPDGRELMLDS